MKDTLYAFNINDFNSQGVKILDFHSDLCIYFQKTLNFSTIQRVSLLTVVICNLIANGVKKESLSTGFRTTKGRVECT